MAKEHDLFYSFGAVLLASVICNIFMHASNMSKVVASSIFGFYEFTLEFLQVRSIMSDITFSDFV
jgi:hypothetical protein